MGSRDVRKRETKKPKKDAKKLASTVVPITTPEVEVVRRKRKEREEEPGE